MTNTEYITNALGGFNVSSNTVETILAENALTGSDTADFQACKMAMYQSFYLVYPMADISEGDLSISYNATAIKNFYRHLCDALGMPDVLSQPRVRMSGKYW